MARSPDQLAQRYVAWMRTHWAAIVVAHVALAAVSVWLIATRLPLYADFSYLLPQDAPSVHDLRRLQARVKSSDTVLVVVDAPTPAVRERVMRALAADIARAAPDLVEFVEADDDEVRAFLKQRRHLFVPLEDLVRARDALAGRIKEAKLKANPLYIDLGDADDAAAAAADREQLERLQARRRDAEARLERPSNVSADGRTGLIQVRTPFRATDAARGKRLLAALGTARARVVATNPGVVIGFTGGIVTAVAEHDAIFNGMVLSSLITGVLVALLLALYFRSATLLGLLIGTLAMATTISFGFAAITVGHLNAATAFLGAIIAGNGINYGILLIARYLEERRRHDVDAALATAIVGTLRPTAVASLGASIAYGSLAATSFKGFADFAIIGAIGMVVCWIATYVLFPTLLLRWGRDTRIYSGDPVIGTTLARLFGFRRSRVVCAVALAGSLIAAAIVIDYVAHDPFEYDIKELRSEGADAVAARHWLAISDRHFGRGIAGRTFIAADRLDQVPQIVAALRKRDDGVPTDQQTIGAINSILDVVPERQDDKLAVLAQIRALLDDPALAALSDDERAELRELRPPDRLAPITADSLPAAIKDRLAEKDGRIGYLIAIRPAGQLDEWNGRDLIRFANAVRKLTLAGGETVTTSGSSVIFADIVASIQHDGPIVTAVAAAGLIVMVIMLVGRNRRAAAVLAGTGAGSLLMVAVCALAGIRVNFLDFVALPITLGLGIDYAINIAHRQHHDQVSDPAATLRTSGSAVFVCSLTTIIGYGSLLVSDNLAIRGFGTASLIGEVACVFTALVLVPAIVAVGARHPLRADPAAGPE